MGDREAPDGLAWHYTSGAGLLSIVSSHTVWATSSAFLNDQQEVALGGALVARRIMELADAGTDELFTVLAAQVTSAAESGRGPGPGHCYILSASRSSDSLAMWRLYGGLQESYAIGLDPDVPLAVLTSHDVEPPGRDQGIYLQHQPWQPVAYAAERQRALVDAVLLDLPARVTSLGAAFDPRHLRADAEGPRTVPDVPVEIRTEIEDLLDAIQQALLLIKHEGFVDERETRYCVVFVPGPGSDRGRELEARLLSYRPTSYGMAPYLRLTGSPAVGGPSGPDGVPIVSTAAPLPIRAVAISPSPNGAEATTSVRQLLAAHGYDGLPVLRSTIPFRA